MIVSHSTLGIGLYLLYRKNVIAQFKTSGHMIGHHTRLRENDDLLLLCIKKKSPFFNARKIQ